MTVQRSRLSRWATTAIVACLISALAFAAPALAKWSASVSGSGAAQAIDMATPAAPGATSFGLLFLTCTVNVSWPAPPAGQRYTIYRTMNGSTSAWVSNQSGAGNNVGDTFLLPGLFARNISYFIRSNLVAATGWTVDSPSTSVSC